MPKTYTFDEVQQHRSPQSCWVVLYGHVYDVTSFLSSHPGGSKVILQLAGTDATEEYDPIHPPGTLEENLPEESKLGPFDETTLPAIEQKAEDQPHSEQQQQQQQQSSNLLSQQQQPPQITNLEECLNLDDIERLATQKLSRKAWGYYYSAGDDLLSKRLNNTVYSQILLRPRVFVDCTRCDTSTTLLNNQYRVQVPFYVSPAAMARLGHPDGEHGIARACSRFGAMQIISNNSSQTPEQIVQDASSPDQVFGWQMYVQDDRKKSEAMLARVQKLPKIKFVVLTLDAPVPGKREHDERTKNVGANLPVRSAVVHNNQNNNDDDNEGAKPEPSGDGGVGKSLFMGTAADLTWKTTLPWLQQHTSLPIVLKGVQTHEDAYMAYLHAQQQEQKQEGQEKHQQIHAIILSNHGGRALDTAPPAVHTLLEIRKFCPEVLTKIEIWVDGGIRRGTDIVKALALGAKLVGIGRAPLYGLGAGGTAGVERTLEILRDEVDRAMRLLGVERVEELGPQHVNARAVERDIYDGVAGTSTSIEKLGLWVKSKL